MIPNGKKIEKILSLTHNDINKFNIEEGKIHSKGPGRLDFFPVPTPSFPAVSAISDLPTPSKPPGWVRGACSPVSLSGTRQ